MKRVYGARQVLAQDGALTEPEAVERKQPRQPACAHPSLAEKPGHLMRATCQDCRRACHRPYPGDPWRATGALGG